LPGSTSSAILLAVALRSTYIPFEENNLSNNLHTKILDTRHLLLLLALLVPVLPALGGVGGGPGLHVHVLGQFR
jgi:hypothetical protein